MKIAVALVAVLTAGCTSSIFLSPSGGGGRGVGVIDKPREYRLGQTARIKTDEYVADVTVARPPRNSRLSPFASRGHYLGVLVTVRAIRGSTSVNPLFVSATSRAGDSYDAELGAIDHGELPAKDLPPGRAARGLVAFRVPTSFRGEVEWDTPLGDPLAYWHR